MATNIIMEPGYNLSVVCDYPAVPTSGMPVRFGALTGIALTDESADGNATGYTSVYFGPCVVDVAVLGNDGGASAVAVGDTIFFVDAAQKLSKVATGYFFGFALETVQAGATTTIRVYHPASPGAGTLAAGAVGSAELANNGVTAGKLTASLGTGFIDLPLTTWRILDTNDIAAKNAADGGVISLDTIPTLKRVNGATDKNLRLTWAATSVIEIANAFVYPPDLNEAAVVEVHILAAMAAAADTPVIGVSYFEGVGDTNAGGNTAAITGATVAEYTVTIAHANIGATPKSAAIGLVPAAHGTDALHIYGIWIEYSRM